MLTSVGRAVVRCLVLAMALLIASPVAAAGDSRHRWKVSTASPSIPTPGADEITSLRTRTSRTYEAEDGSHELQLGSASINFRDAQGRWRRIDNNLAVDGAVLHNGANRYRLTLPRRLDASPVRVSKGDAWIAFSPVGVAPRSADVHGSAATFAGAWPGVVLEYTATGDSVKEAMVVSDRSHVRDFAFDVRIPAGYTLVQHRDGSIALRDARGATPLRLSPSTMIDAAGATARSASRLSRTAHGWRLVVIPDRAWLDRQERRWPVTVDPTVTLGTSLACQISGDGPDWGACGVQPVVYEWADRDGHQWSSRALVRFDLTGSLPAGAEIENAVIDPNPVSSYGPVGFFVSGVASPWTENVTFLTSDGTNPWPPPGSAGWPAWTNTADTTELVRGWQSGEIPNYGVFIVHGYAAEAGYGGPSAQLDPILKIDYAPADQPSSAGVRRGHTYDTYRITDRQSLSVDVTNGNLLLSSQDLQISGTGLDLSLQRYFNSRDGGTGELGRHARFGVGRDVELNQCDLDNAPNSRCMIAPSGFRARFRRQSDGSFESPAGINATLKRNADGTFTLTDHRSGQKMHFFDLAHSYMSSIEDRHDNKIDFDYVDGNLSKITDTQGREIDVTVNEQGDITRVEDPQGRAWIYDYPYFRKLGVVTDPAGSVTHYGYDAEGRLTSITDPRGSQIQIGYDDHLRVTSITRQISNNRAEDVTTIYEYSDDLSDPCSDGGEQVGRTELTDPRGKTTTYCWDDRGRVRKTEDADGNKRAKTYTSNDDVATFTDLEGTAAGTFQFNYDSSTNNLTGGQGASGEVFGVGYCGQAGEPACTAYEEAQFQPTSITSPNGSKTNMSYNATGDMTRIGASASGVADSVDLDYNDDGTLHTATDGEGHTTTFGYDVDGNLNEIDPPGDSIKKTTFTVDALSRLASVRDGRHQGTTAKQIESVLYDGVDRVTRINYGDGSWFAFQYDADGNMTSRSNGVGTTTSATTAYVYDRRNLRLSEDFPGTPFNAYTYDASGNLATLTDPGGAVSYGYDDINRVTTVTQPGGATVSLVYNDDERRTTVTFPGGIFQRTNTDKSGKTTSISVRDASNTLLRQLDYDYSDNGACAGSTTAQRTLVQRVTDENGRATCYLYDAVDRVDYAETRGSGGGFVESFDYSYDGASNRTRKVHETSSGTTTTSYGYNAANQLCWRASGDHDSACEPQPAGATDYDYDDSGNEILEQGGRQSTYDIRNRLVSLSGTAFGYLTPTNGELVGVGTTALQNNLLGVGRVNSTSYTRTPDGAVLSQRTGSAIEYYLRDRLDSTVGLVSGTSIVRNYGYDPDGNADSTGSGATTPIRFAGGYTTNGLYHFGLRYYDPNIGRWTQPDLQLRPGDLKQVNGYLYAAGNPLNFTDSTGADIFDDVQNAIDDGILVEAYSVVETAAVTVGFTALAVGGTAACVGATAGAASVACGAIFVTNITAAAAAGYATYQEGSHFAEKYG